MKKSKVSFKKMISNALIILIILVFVCACSNEDITDIPPSGNTDIAITHYSYGKMVLDGKTYGKDLAILPDGKIADWAFDYTYHNISPEDLSRYISEDVKTIIIGRGYERIASLSESAEELIKTLKSRGVEVHYLQSSKAVKLFNSLSKVGLLAFFHLSS